MVNYMKKAKISWLMSILITIVTIVSISFIITNRVNAASLPSYLYRAHVMDKGWLSDVTSGRTAGTTGESRRMEAFCITVKNGKNSGVSYRAYCADEGWQRWKNSGQNAGTIGKKRQVEALQIKLTNGLETKYDIYYRVHCAGYGWLGWAKNGETAGGTGKNLRVEAFQLKIVVKGFSFSRGGNASYVSKIPNASYRAHVMNKGWLSSVSLGETAGTTGESLRLEAFRISIMNGVNSGVSYRAHCSDIGWQDWKSSGGNAGTVGEKRQIEAIQIKLTNGFQNQYDIYYRAHCAGYGWLGWAKNGEVAGTVGKNLRMEAFQVEIVQKGEYFSRGGISYVIKKNEQPVSPAASFQLPLDGARCTWRSKENWSWATNRGGSGRVYHLGIDIIGSNDNVHATASGSVAACGWNKANGNYVVLQHDINGKKVYSFYAHLKKINTSKGAKISMGATIGQVGNTGSSSAGKHLHFAMMDTLWSGSYYGYATYFTGDKVSYKGVTYYNPRYIINNGRLP